MDDEDPSPDNVELAQRFTEVRLHESERPFTEVVHDYRRIEEEFVTRASDNKEFALHVKRRMSRLILSAAYMAGQPYEVCRVIWEELVERGFSDHEKKRIHTGIYARCCQMNGEFAAGIAVLEPLITEMEQALEGKALKKKERKWYEKDVMTFRKIRDELKAGIRE